MKKYFILFTLLLLTANYLFPQPSLEWTQSYYFRGESMAMDSIGNVVITGFRDSNIFINKYTSSGQLIWTRDTAIYPNGIGINSAIDKYGNIYISLEVISSRLQLIKYDSSGHLKWNNLYLNQANRCKGIALDTSGNIFLTCESFVGRYEYLTIKYYPTGNIAWERRYSGNYGARVPYSIFVDKTGSVFVTGSNNVDTIRNKDYATIKYNNGGDLQWTSLYNGKRSSDDAAYSVFADNYGYCYVTGGSTYTIGRSTCATIKYNISGDSVWTRIYPSDTTSGELFLCSGVSVSVDSPGNIYVAGAKMIVASTYGRGITALKYDKNGNFKWYRIDSAAYNLKSATLDTKSNFFIIGDGLGRMKGSGYDSLGNKIWNFSHPKNTYNAVKILCNKFGGLYVLSSSLDTTILFKFSLPTGIRSYDNEVVQDYKLEQNYPNPFNPSTKIRYSISNGFRTKTFRNDRLVSPDNRLNVTLKIYDILGREVVTLVNEKQSPGTYEVNWNACRGGSSSEYPSGVYFYKLVVGDYESSSGQVYTETKRMVLIK